MRIRTIKPEFWSHPVLSRLDDSTRVLAIGLLNIADDEGYFLADPALIRSAIWPLDEDSTKARRTLVDLSRSVYVEVRDHATHGAIGLVVNFRKHQRVDRPTPSKIKAYFDSAKARRVLDERSLLEQGTGNREQGSFLPPPDGDCDAVAANGQGEWQSAEQPKTRKPRERDLLFDALASACGCSPAEMTKDDARACGVALSKIKAVAPGLTPAEIARRAENYRTHYEGAALTPSALCKHWAVCASTRNSTTAPNGQHRPSFDHRNIATHSDREQLRTFSH